LSAIAELPGRIERIFDTKEYQPSGCYTVNMLSQGVKTEYVIDDFFPCNGNQAAFSGPKR
jgi:hypothetical protein